ncbi:hypothetical protein SeMB42_g05053 [Synchytrium endobioticum]|uniref:Telomerase reverse transcriptase n=1 Tax=Synchytrium endobioticum TaxID=286115 RepID=A0A507CQI4_9FUNG|nr:hypothetical protein SeLEV6574_g06115 [Synchytrium endobioticum]TPX42623.1 hypothetical protein SeMB42_g05053 [Synchytrium endobioticum]
MEKDVPGLSRTVLHQIYNNVQSIQDFITSISSPSASPSTTLPGSLKNENDAPWITFLQSTMVCCMDDLQTAHTRTPVISLGASAIITTSQSEVVDRVIRRCIKSHVRKHVLCQGFRNATGENNAAAYGLMGDIERTFPNTMVKYVKSSLWSRLLRFIGDDVMFFLLCYRSVFVALPNGCYLQVSGPSMADISVATATSEVSAPLHFKGSKKRKHRNKEIAAIKRTKTIGIQDDDTAADNLPKKKTRNRRFRRRKPLDKNHSRPPEHDSAMMDVDNETKETTTVALAPPALVETVKTNDSVVSRKEISRPQPRSASNVTLPRDRIFYSRATHGVKGNVLCGLPRIHILNRYRLQELRKFKTPSNTPTQLPPISLNTVLAYIFPRQFALDNIFDHKVSQFGNDAIPDYTVRPLFEEKNKMSWRLKKPLDLVRQLIKLYAGCNIQALYDKHCPIPGDVFGATPLQQRDYLKWSVSFFQVSNFVKAIVKNVLPCAFFGSQHNENVISSVIDRIVRLRRFENMKLSQVLNGFKILDCEWLQPSKLKLNQQVPLSDYQKRYELLQEFLYWLFDGLVIPLLKTSFYATETTTWRNRVVYFRSDVWKMCCAPVFKNLSASLFKKMGQSELRRLVSDAQLSFSRVRLLPKRNGVRPIINLRRKFYQEDVKKLGQPPSHRGRRRHLPPQPTYKPDQFALSINYILQNAFQVLSYEKNNNGNLRRGSVLGLTDIYTKLKTFATALRTQYPSKLPQLYFVKVDITRAFDTINQDKLLQILEDVFTDDDYFIIKYVLASFHTGKYSKSFVKRAFPGSVNIHFPQIAHDMAKGLRRTVVADQVVYPRVDKEEVWHLIEEHISAHIVKVGRQLYRQISGIPQGSVLSSLLCSLYYAHLEQSALSFTSTDNDGLLLHYVDDFLYMTTNRDKANQFLEVMMAGIPDYGVHISMDKTLTNFDAAVGNFTIRSIHGDDFPWCGHLVNTTNLGVRADYSRMTGHQFRESLTVEYGSHPGHVFRRRVLSYIKPKAHALFFDTSLAGTGTLRSGRLDDGRMTVLLNVYQNLKMCSMRFHMYLKQLRNVRDGGNGTRDKFLLGTIYAVIRLMAMFINSRTRTVTAKMMACECRIECKEVTWLGVHAFYTTLRIKQTEYAAILQELKRGVESDEFIPYRKGLRDVVSHQSNSVFEDMLY